ncbi:MAG: Asp-tRNA(Asn)/Glu-tRNA(Gln) amidotransferase subunit GatB [Candidatus Pacebacteria bacterium]|nr:Asp-tRNA(Asn)/Glu-tRNA(Gln) amidotransferase subunit GatB [Candidatus Paceibacterota bacterium]
MKSIQTGTPGEKITMTNQKYQLVCGMEVHAELKTNSKMFCGCKNDPFHAEKPNIYTCPVCLGLPGALPVANKQAIEWTIKLGLALGCKINLFSKFDRKHYFYPDLPKGYQISQYDLPFCYDGKIETELGTVRIHRIHLEEDTGKLLHKTVNGEQVSLIDFNRSSVPLIEIVTEPDITTAAHAAAYGKQLRKILQYLDIANCDMEQGGMRLEANVSLRPVGETELPNYKTEIKNINSFRFLEQAIDFEIDRQAELLANNQIVSQETRGWNSVKQVTYSQRSKEDAEDYRYFPDPDIPPIRFTEEQIAAIRETIPELPSAIATRWQQEYGIEPNMIEQIIVNTTVSRQYDKLFTNAKNEGISVASLLKNILSKKVPSPLEAGAEQTLLQFKELQKTDVVDDTQLIAIVNKVLTENPDISAKYFSGQKQVIGFVMGQILRELPKKSDPAQVREAIITQLEATK